MDARALLGRDPRPVLIVGTPPRVALAVARSLSRRGIRVIAATASDDERRLGSSSISQHVALGDALERSEEFDAGLERVARRSGADLLMPCSDKALAAVARNYEKLRAIADPGCPPPDVVAGVLDKTATIAAARALRIDVPATYDLASPDVDPRALAYPVIAKPKNHAGLGGIRIRYFCESSDLRDAQRADARFGARYLVQQFVPGFGVGVAVLMRAGSANAVFMHRRLKELPAAGGVSVLSESIAPDRSLANKAIALLASLRWEGVAFVEFRCAPDGTAWLMEINGRYWGTLSTALAAGVDFPFHQWQAAHGLTLTVPQSYAAGVRVRWTRGAILRLRERLFEPPGFGTQRTPAAEEVRSFLRDFSPSVRSALWSARDPLPAVADVMPALWRFLKSAVGAFAKKIVPRGLVRARRRFGVGGMLEYVWPGRAALPRPFVPRAVLFVCSGNIMRSALAAAVFRAKLNELGVEGVAVDSSGLHASPGTPADPRAIGAAGGAGLDLTGHRAQLMSDALARDYDAIFVMDRLLELELRRRFPACAAKSYSMGVEIPDPYLADEQECHRIFDLVQDRAAALAAIAAEDASRARGARAETPEADANGAGAT